MNPGESHEVLLEGVGPNVSAWSPDAPSLYSAAVGISMDGRNVDCQTVRFGFRTICVRDGKVLLNGESVFFNGFNRHEDYPDTKLAINQAISRQDFEEIKKSGANFVRMCHYPHDSEELDWCDELGLLVMDEIPLCALLVEVPGTSSEEARQALGLTLDHAKAQLRRLIARDFNHPSVIFWSVSNETNEREPGVTEMNNTLIRLAKKLDPSRLAMHVSMEAYWCSDLVEKLFPCDDVVCVNKYLAIHERLYLHNEGYGLSRAEEYWAEHAKILAAAYPGKPVFVTEFGYQTGHSHDGVEDEEIQSKMIAIDYAAMRPHVCGALVWCFADHAWPLLWPSRAPMFGRDISLYGVMTRDRKKKIGFEAYKKIISE
jgi:beta-glucuronidase